LSILKMDKDNIKMPFLVSAFLLLYDFIQKVWGYLMMLLIMSFNLWTVITLALGLTIGYAIT